MKTKFENIKSLPDKVIFEGIKHCFNNSSDLFSSALALKRNKKYNTATSLLILSIEELMSSLVLFYILILDPDKRDKFRYFFNSTDIHKCKHDFALFMNEYLKMLNINKIIKSNVEINDPRDLSAFLSKKIELQKVLKKVETEKKTFNNWFLQANEKKNAGLYVVYNDKWHLPQRINEKVFLKALKETKSVRDKVSILLKVLISIEDKDFDNIFNFMKQAMTYFESEAGE